MNASEVLNKAADLIEERGWQRGQGWVFDGDETAELCLEGGIMAAAGLVVKIGGDDTKFAPLFDCPAYRAVISYLDRVQPTVNVQGIDGQPLFYWNDDEARDAEHVIEVLRAAAVIEASRERQAAEVSA